MYSPHDFDYPLDPKYIAQIPANPRDAAKLMVINRPTRKITHRIFRDILDILTPNDVIVLNDTKVFPARLKGVKDSGGKTEVLLIRPLNSDIWEAMGKNLKPGETVVFDGQMTGRILTKDAVTGYLTLQLEHSDSLDQVGTTPIPPYIHSPLSEAKLRQEYQTVYASERGSAAAPTAGMHFTPTLLEQLVAKGVGIEKVTLHVGPGTFAKLTPENIRTGQLHHEQYSISPSVADRLNLAKQTGKRIVAVGTTSCRTLESASSIPGSLIPGSSSTSLFIMPPYKFNFVDALITNFHLPESSLLMLVTAFCGDTDFNQSLVHTAYQTAMAYDYRFFSFGDAMLIE